jgi:hypothetical protein
MLAKRTGRWRLYPCFIIPKMLPRFLALEKIHSGRNKTIAPPMEELYILVEEYKKCDYERDRHPDPSPLKL